MLTITEKLQYCLTCGGTGKKGNLSGKKKCPVCLGTGKRDIEYPNDGRTVCDSGLGENLG